MPESLTLIICTLGRTQPVQRLLASLREQTDRRFKAIIVDQNEPGYLDPILRRFPDLHVIHARSARGLSRARNIGIAMADTPLVAFPDDDCWYRSTTVAEVISRFEDNAELAVLTGRTIDAEGRDSVSVHLSESQPITRSNVFLAGNSNTIFARRKAVNAVGGFDEALGVGAGTKFGSGDETDFLLSCLKRDFVVHYDRDFLIHHDQVGEDRLNTTRVRAYSTGFGRVCRMHQLGTFFVGSRVARAGARSVLFLIRGDLREARLRWAWIRGCLSGFAAGPP